MKNLLDNLQGPLGTMTSDIGSRLIQICDRQIYCLQEPFVLLEHYIASLFI